MKSINDAFGHLTGDRAIEIVGQAIRNSIRREGDIGIPFGGDEFIVLLSNQNHNTTEKVIERIRQEISKILLSENLNIRISTGVASNGCLADLEGMIEMADTDLYKEKEIKKSSKERNSKVHDLIK